MVALFTLPALIFGCTIFSGTASNGQVWTGNNEDGLFNFKTYLNVFPKDCEGTFGYVTYSYNTPENGANSNAEGGLNEAGLFFDFNALDMFGKAYLVPDRHLKKSFPQGDHEIFNYIMSNFETVQEVVDFFEEYWFDVGFNTAQMHLADRFGNFGMINATGSRVLKDAPFQVSTNFSICDEEDGSKCWRYPIATEILQKEGTSLASFTKACQQTSQSEWGTTIYSNVQNLNTGEIILYYALDYENPYRTSLKELFSKGEQSYLMSDLFDKSPIAVLQKTYKEKGVKAAYQYYLDLEMEENAKKQLLNSFVMASIVGQADLGISSFLDEFLAGNPFGYIFRLSKAVEHYYNGESQQAIEVLNKYYKAVPETSLDIPMLVNRMNGKFPDDMNVTIELEGHQDAHSVLVKGLPGPPQLFFLEKKDGKWVGKFKLGQGVYYYSFIVDGKEILDSKQPIKEVVSLFSEPTQIAHQVCVDMSENLYQRTIRVRVPHPNDEIFIAGNQKNLVFWNSVLRLKRVSDLEREITLNLHLPARFKFTRGNWETEAIMKGQSEEREPILIELDTEEEVYEIVNWKDKM